MPAFTRTALDDIPKVECRDVPCDVTPGADEVRQIHARAHAAFRAGKAQSISYRKEQIAQVGYLLKDNEQRFKDALKADLGRPELETEL